MNTVQAVYASTSGNVEFVVESVVKKWGSWDIAAELHRAEITDASVINDNNLFLFATSTWEHGVINPFFSKLLREMQSIDCSGKKAFFIGCGDRRYEPVLFCEGMKILKKVFEKQGGEVLGEALLLNGSPYAQLETHIAPWAMLQYEILRQHA